MTRPLRPTRAILVATVITAATFALGGCSEMSPQTTQLQYAASDGVMGDKGAIGVRNLLLVTGEEGGEASVIATLVNHSDADLSVTVSTEAGQAGSVKVPANSSVAVGPEGAAKATAKISGKPGQLAAVQLAAGGDTLSLKAPILDGTLPEYASLTPSAAPSTTTSTEPGPSGSESSSPSDGTSATASPSPTSTP